MAAYHDRLKPFFLRWTVVSSCDSRYGWTDHRFKTATPKPAADPALHACSALGLAPGDALFVGDSQTDVLCARAAGCPVVCVRDGYNHGIPAEQLGADAVIESFSDLV